MNLRHRSPMHFSRACALLLVAVLLASCGSAAKGGAGSSGSFRVSGAWARTTTVGQTTGVVYLTIKNSSGTDETLVKAEVPSSVAASAELHHTMPTRGSTGSASMNGTSSATSMADDMGGSMSMQSVDGIDVRANGKATLEPGGYHIMLIDVAAPLAKGSTVPVTLTFSDSTTFEVKAVVRDS